MHFQIRKLMSDNTEHMFGELEADETYVGGKRRGSKPGHPGRDSHKTLVFGIVERGGKVAALVTKDVPRATVWPIIEEKVLAVRGVLAGRLISRPAGLDKAGSHGRGTLVR